MSSSSRTLLTTLLAAPAVAVAVGLATVETYRVIDPGSPLFIEAPAATFEEALRDRGRTVEEAFSFLRTGQDPNAPLAVRDERLTGGRVVMVSPLLLAVAAHNEDAVAMLLGAGARTDLEQNRLALCLARAVGDEGIAEHLMREGRMPEPETCPEPGASEAPLVAFARGTP